MTAFLRRCWYAPLKQQPCQPTTIGSLTSIVGMPYTSFAAYQQWRKWK